MKKILFLAAVLTLAVPTFAADLGVTWINATVNKDGTAIPATGGAALKDVVIEWGTCNADNTFNVKSGEKWFPMPATSGVLTGLADNAKWCLRGKSRNNNNQVSETYSNVVPRWVPGPIPMPPVLSSTVNVAWREYSDGRFVLVGYVPLGTECDASRTVQKYDAAFNPISAGSVTAFSGKPVPATGNYFTICGVS